MNLNKIREELGLKPLEMPKDSIEEIRVLLKKTGLDKRAKKLRE